VAMRVLAFAAVVAQIMARSKAVFNGHFVHASSGSSSRRSTRNSGPAIWTFATDQEDGIYCIAMRSAPAHVRSAHAEIDSE
jgi:hypothetical protein